MQALPSYLDLYLHSPPGQLYLMQFQSFLSLKFIAKCIYYKTLISQNQKLLEVGALFLLPEHFHFVEKSFETQRDGNLVHGRIYFKRYGRKALKTLTTTFLEYCQENPFIMSQILKWCLKRSVDFLNVSMSLKYLKCFVFKLRSL